MAKKSTDKQEILTEQQVYDVLEFAREMYNAYPNVFTPDLVNQRLKDVNMNPMSGTKEEIDKALRNPKDSEQQLRAFSEFFEYTNMQYKRMINYLGNMLSFDLTYTCINATEEEMKSKSYKKDLDVVHSFLDSFDVKKEFKKISRMLIRQEAYYCTFRKDGDKFILQELPLDYCKITGRWDYGFLFDFNMLYFISNPGVDINMYPDVFKEYYNRVMTKVNSDKFYDPGLTIEYRNGNWVYYVQTSPLDGMWCFKFNPEQVGQVPFLSALFPDLINAPMMRNLQTNKYIIEASKILVGLIPLLNDNKSGNVKDMLAIAPETAGKFANLLRQGLPDAIRFGIAPFGDVKSFDYKGNDVNVYGEYNTTTGAMSGINTRLLYSTDKQNAEETRSSIAVDEYLMTYIYPYFNDFLNFHVNQMTKKFKFDFRFEGTENPLNRETRLQNSMTLADKGIVLPQKIAASQGMLPHEFERQLAMARASGFVDKLTPILTSFTLSKEDSKGGRPTKDGELSDSGQATRDSGSNIEKGGKV